VEKFSMDQRKKYLKVINGRFRKQLLFFIILLHLCGIHLLWLSMNVLIFNPKTICVEASEEKND
jgi:hypothetical protein